MKIKDFSRILGRAKLRKRDKSGISRNHNTEV